MQKSYAVETPMIRVVTGTLTLSASLVLHKPDKKIDLDYFGYGQEIKSRQIRRIWKSQANRLIDGIEEIS
jgi:PP-loop superfamily ATP-utilizing enzyme